MPCGLKSLNSKIETLTCKHDMTGWSNLLPSFLQFQVFKVHFYLETCLLNIVLSSIYTPSKKTTAGYIP